MSNWNFIFLASLSFNTNRFHVFMGLYSDRLWKTSVFIKKINDTLCCSLWANFLFLPDFHVICDLLLNKLTATWNLFVNLINWFALLGFLRLTSPTKPFIQCTCCLKFLKQFWQYFILNDFVLLPDIWEVWKSCEVSI